MFLFYAMFVIYIPACEGPFSRRSAARRRQRDGLTPVRFGEIKIFFILRLVRVVVCAPPETVEVVVGVRGYVVDYGKKFVEVAKEEGLVV